MDWWAVAASVLIQSGFIAYGARQLRRVLRKTVDVERQARLTLRLARQLAREQQQNGSVQPPAGENT